MIAPDLQPLAQPIDTLHTLEGNPRRGDVEAVARSYDQFGQRKPIVARRDGTVIAGNHQLLAARLLGWPEIAVVYVDDDDLTAKAYALADNRVGDLGGYDSFDLEQMLSEVSVDPSLLEATGYSPLPSDLPGSSSADPSSLPQADPAEPRPSIADRFVFPPFTVLDARSGAWQERKRRWLSVGIRSEVGRGDNLLGMSDTVLASGKALTLSSLSGRIPDYYDQKNEIQRRLGRDISNEEFERDFLVIPDGPDTLSKGGTSIFDPVLCELIYRWWSPQNGLVLDPFAGGSVRGIMAGLLGRRYLGIDLRAEQIEANEQQRQEIIPSADIRWICGDSRALLPEIEMDQPADLLFSCPPYADLEIYSDDPADISNMEIDKFIDAYRAIIQAGVDRLADNRFAAIVIGDARDSRGIYYNLIGETVRAFRDAGCSFYNEAILVTSVGSLPIRIGRIFPAGRKLGKTHQNLLVFVKGDPKKATEACGPIEIDIPEMLGAEEAMP